MSGSFAAACDPEVSGAEAINMDRRALVLGTKQKGLLS